VTLEFPIELEFKNVDFFEEGGKPENPEKNLSDQGAISRKSRKLFGPVKPLKNLEPCYYRAVLFTNSKDKGKFPSYNKFQAYTLPRF